MSWRWKTWASREHMTTLSINIQFFIIIVVLLITIQHPLHSTSCFFLTALRDSYKWLHKTSLKHLPWVNNLSNLTPSPDTYTHNKHAYTLTIISGRIFTISQNQRMRLEWQKTKSIFREMTGGKWWSILYR